MLAKDKPTMQRLIVNTLENASTPLGFIQIKEAIWNSDFWLTQHSIWGTNIVHHFSDCLRELVDEHIVVYQDVDHYTLSKTTKPTTPTNIPL